MEKVYEHYETGDSEGSYRGRSDAVAQNNCY